MLLDWPEEQKAWDLVATLGGEAERHFWSHRRLFRFEGPTHEMEKLVHRFVTAGRAGDALAVMHPRERELSWPPVMAILSGRVGEVTESSMDEYISSYLLGELFKSMRDRHDINQLELARWEYTYFPILQRQNADFAFYDPMASDPEFFVSIMKDVFVAHNVDPNEQASTPEQRNRGLISHSILIHNDKIPSEKDGMIDQDALDA